MPCSTRFIKLDIIDTMCLSDNFLPREFGFTLRYQACVHFDPLLESRIHMLAGYLGRNWP